MKKFSTLIALLLAITMVFTACAPPKEETVKPNSEATADKTEEAKTDAPTEAEPEKATEAPATEAETEAPTEEKTEAPSEEETEAPAEEETEEEKAAETEAEKLPAAAADEEKETEAEAKEEAEPEAEKTEPEKEAAEEKEDESEAETAEIEKLPPITVGLATDTGGVDDKSFNQGTWEGILRYAKDQNLPKENYQYVQATSDADYVPQLTTYADMGLDLIVAPGFLFKSAITEVANDYPDQNFLFIDDASDAPNVLNAVFAEHEGSYLVGVAAGLKADAAMRQRAERAMIIKQLLYISQFDELKTMIDTHSVAVSRD